MMQKTKKISQSMSCPAISFSNPTGNGQTYRGIQAEPSSSLCVQHYSIDELSGPSMKATPASQFKSTSSKSCSVIQFSLNSASTNYPTSKALSNGALMMESAFKPLDILCTEMDSDTELEHDAEMDSDMIMSPMSMEEPASLVPTTSSFKYCNELNSCLVDNSACFQILNVLNNILLHYKCNDIDFHIDYQHQRIDGLVFLSNYCVFWMICVYDEASLNPQNQNETHAHHAKQTRVEFRRTSGDALASAKFWSEIKTLLQRKQASNRPDDATLDQEEHGQSTQIDEPQPLGFISLDLSVTAMDTDLPALDGDDEEHAHFSERELDQLTEALVENDLFVIDELQFLYEAMVKHESVCYQILAHQPLLAQLVNHSMVNQDVCVTRAALLILNLLSQTHADGICSVDGLRLFENANVLLNHPRQLVKKYAIRLLAHLCADECEWKIQESSRQQMIQNVRRYETQFANHLAQEIRTINQKLMTKK